MPSARSPLAEVLADLGRAFAAIGVRWYLFGAQAEARTIEDVVVPVASALDLVVMKVLAGRPQDLEDATAVLRAQGDGLDAARARTMLRELERALDRRDLVAAFDSALAQARRP